MTNNPLQSLKAVFVEFFSLKGYIEDQSAVEDEIRQGVSFKGTNILILIFAILVASLGLNTNSTAVIIGAMLISPLMGPIIGIGLAIGVQDFDLLRRSLRNLAMAAMISMAASTVFFIISPVAEGHSELLARTQPTIYDVLIAFFGGGAGIIGMSSRSKGNVIPGVAIATALMPPLCTAGYGLATLQMHYFLGAAYLFLINSIFIALATFIGVKLMNFNNVEAADKARAARVRKWVYTIAILTVLPSIFLTYSMLRDSRFNINADKFVTTEMSFPATQVLSHKLVYAGGERTLDVTLIGRVLPVDSLTAVLTPRMKQYGLGNVRLNIIQGGISDLSMRTSAGSSVSEVYNAAQSAITARQATIDSLRNVLATQQYRDTIGAAMAPELKVVFPDVCDIAISRNVVCNVTTGSLDTVEMALVRFTKAPSQPERLKLKQYIEARIGARDVNLIDY